jgi:hypothetical protein
MSAGNSSRTTLIIVAAIVVIAVIGFSVMKNRSGDSDTGTELTEASQPATTETADVGASGPAEGVDAPASGETPQPVESGRTRKPRASSPDITFVAWEFQPAAPVPGEPVIVRASVKNDGGKAAPAFNVAWHASADQSVPVHVWLVPKLNPGSRHTLEFEYTGYKNEHANLETMLVIDPEGVVVDKDRANNHWVKTITVARQ